MMENPSYHLEGVVREKNELQDFEGPLSLILMLLSKNKIEIRDLKIADILDQYLDYLARMQSMDLEIASEFVQMASHLLYIKTKTLLSSDEGEPSELELLMQSLEALRARDTLAAIAALGAACAAEFFVSPTGDDNAAGTFAAPLATPARAASSAASRSTPGATT